MKIGLSSLVFILMMGLSLSAQTKVNVDRNQLALKGYDPVAYFEDQKPLKGKPTYQATYQNAVYQFASSKHLDIFKKNPAKYVPEYGGFCAYGVSRGYAVGVDPEAWSIVNGKLYLNYSLKVQQTWNEDKPGYIKKANENWPKVGEQK